MKTNIKDIIERLRVISDLAREEDESIARLYGKTDLGITLNSESIQMVCEPAPCEKALYGFLNELPDGILFALLVLMYAGRDNVEDVYDYIQDISSTFSSKERAILAISEKSPRMDYIIKGIEYLGENNLTDFVAKVESRIKS